MPSSYGVVQLAYDIAIGGQFRFDVDGVVTNNGYCLGLAGFMFQFDGTDDNNILDMGVYLTGVSLSTSNGKSTITGTVAGSFEDDNKHKGNVYTQVVLIAALQGSFSQPTMANPPGFASGDVSQVITVNDASPIFTAILSGFSMGYTDGSDQSVNQIGATVTQYPNGNTATIGGSCVLEESSKTKATSLMLYGGLLADSNSTPVFEVVPYRASTNMQSGSVKFSQEVTSAQALLVGFNAQYSGTDTHKVNKVGASYNDFFSPTGSNAGLQPDKRTFMFLGSGAFMNDDESNTQDNSTSYAQFVVIGAVKQQS